MFDFIKLPFGYLLEWLIDFTGNYGVAILLFSLIVKLILLPASAKSKKAMMKQSRLAPQLKELELACGDDKAKYQQETMRLYKEEGVSMTGGCLWSLLPMLILLPLYAVIRNPMTWVMHIDTATKDLIKEAFTAGGNTVGAYWQMIVAADPAKYLGEGSEFLSKFKDLHMSFLGIDLAGAPSFRIWLLHDWAEIGASLIPLLSGGMNMLAMFISQKMNEKVITDDKGQRDEAAVATAQRSGKAMMYTMPIMSVAFGFMVPTALSLYWTAQSALGIIQDFILTKHYKKVYDAEDAVKKERARLRAMEEAEKERIRAQKRAENPDGILENTSKKKLEKKKAQEREAAARQSAQSGASSPAQAADSGSSTDAKRPNSRGRAYDPNRYSE